MTKSYYGNKSFHISILDNSGAITATREGKHKSTIEPCYFTQVPPHLAPVYEISLTLRSPV